VIAGDPGTLSIDGRIFNPYEIITGTVNTIEVTDIDEYISKVEE
jgi:hypothetical protein